MADQFVKVGDVVDYWAGVLETNKATIGSGIRRVQTYDDTIVTEYPCLLITPSPEEKIVHGTHTYLFNWRIMLYVFHADLASDRMTRNKADVELAQAVADFMETDKTLDGRVNFSHVAQKAPGAVPPFVTNRSTASVCTRLLWAATSQGRF